MRCFGNQREVLGECDRKRPFSQPAQTTIPALVKVLETAPRPRSVVIEEGPMASRLYHYRECKETARRAAIQYLHEQRD
jgi:hypothetical protein